MKNIFEKYSFFSLLDHNEAELAQHIVVHVTGDEWDHNVENWLDLTGHESFAAFFGRFGIFVELSDENSKLKRCQLDGVLGISLSSGEIAFV